MAPMSEAGFSRSRDPAPLQWVTHRPGGQLKDDATEVIASSGTVRKTKSHRFTTSWGVAGASHPGIMPARVWAEV